ncbi:sigma factor-like helix-turn-helix DNA-binding protein [Mammaliicoccus sciuri]|uniref:sigma factor-like helix-turn-helix DNA-binding protein n=1 Tax=Mammaliicoccus sciuri TaxID=1296 RepID=UPI0036E82746
MFEWLKLYRKLDMEQETLKLKRDICMEEIDRWQTISDTRVDLGKKHDFISRIRQIDRIRDELKELNDCIEIIENQKKRVLKLIDKFEGVEHQILKLRYVEGMTHGEIADQLGYAEQSIKNIHSSIIKQINFASKVKG